MLSQYPDVAALAETPLDELAALLDVRSRGVLKDSHENARKLHQALARALPNDPGSAQRNQHLKRGPDDPL